MTRINAINGIAYPKTEPKRLNVPCPPKKGQLSELLVLFFLGPSRVRSKKQGPDIRRGTGPWVLLFD